MNWDPELELTEPGSPCLLGPGVLSLVEAAPGHTVSSAWGCLFKDPTQTLILFSGLETVFLTNAPGAIYQAKLWNPALGRGSCGMDRQEDGVSPSPPSVSPRSRRAFGVKLYLKDLLAPPPLKMTMRMEQMEGGGFRSLQ